MSESHARTCARCGCAISPDELAEGLAVQMGEELVCPTCVDLLPTGDQSRILRLRAMRGLHQPIYRVHLPKAPRAHTYTFATAASFATHRKALRESGDYAMPPLPASEANRSRPGTSSVKRPSTRIQAPEATAAQPSAASSGLPGGPLPWILGGGGVAVAVIIAVALLASSGGETPRLAQEPSEILESSATTAALADPQAAWRAAADLRPDHPRAILARWALSLAKDNDLSEAERFLSGFRFREARERLDHLLLPDGPAFAAVAAREQVLRARLAQAIAQAEQSNTTSTPDTTVAATAPANQATTEKPITLTQEPLDTAPATAAISEALSTKPPTETITNSPNRSEAIAAQGTFRGPITDMLPATSGLAAAGWESLRGGKFDVLRNRGSAKLARDLLLPAGRWRLWLKLHRDQAGAAQLLSDLGGTPSALANYPRGQYAWRRTETVATSDGTTPLTLTISVAGEGWFLQRVGFSHPATTDHPDDDQASVPWQPFPTAIAIKRIYPSEAPPAQRGELPHYERVDGWNEPAILSISGNAVIPLTGPEERIVVTRPANSGRYLMRSPRNSSNKLPVPMGGSGSFVQMIMPVDTAACHDGGLVIHLHPGQRLRPLAVHAVRGGSIDERPLLEIPGGEAAWQSIRIPFGNGPAPEQLLIVPTQRGTTTTFWVTGIVAISGRPPAAGDEQLGSPALIHPGNQALRQVLREVVSRSKADWRKEGEWGFDPRRVSILCGVGLSASWRTDMRAQLAALRGLKPDALPARSVEALLMQTEWLTNRFINTLVDENLAKVTSEPNAFHAVMILTAGTEVAAGLSQPQALRNFWDRAISESRKLGLLPIPVLGPSKLAGGAPQGSADALWNALDEHLRARHPGIPVIDLREVGITEAGAFRPGESANAVMRIREALRELQQRLQLLYPPKNP